jgi:ArsR family transcriptional regulator
MKENSKARYEVRAKVIKALAHPARLQMVDELAQGPLCVNDIRARVGSDLSTISRHLAVLKNVGILKDEKKGLQVFYTLRCPCVADFFACAEKVLRLTGRKSD